MNTTNNQKLEQQKISNGCCIICFDTQNTSYRKLTIDAADKVVKFLNIPVTIITDEKFDCNHDFIIIDRPQNNKRKPKDKDSQDWFNIGRTNLYDITPYDRTLVIDSDFIINSDALLNHFNANTSNFLMAKEIYNPITGNLETIKLGRSNLDQYWATVMIFNKSNEAQNIFNMAKVVEKNYDYYSTLYGFYPRPYRNDYIFSIALHLLGGYSLKSYALRNYPLINCNNQIKYVTYDGNSLVYEYIKNGQNYKNKLSNLDLHLMNKDQL